MREGEKKRERERERERAREWGEERAATRELRRAARLHAQTCARRVNVAASRAQLASDNEHSKVNTTTKGSSERPASRLPARARARAASLANRKSR